MGKLLHGFPSVNFQERTVSGSSGETVLKGVFRNAITVTVASLYVPLILSHSINKNKSILPDRGSILGYEDYDPTNKFDM